MPKLPARHGVGADEPDGAVGAYRDVGAAAGKLGPGGAVPVVDEVARVDDPGVAAGSTAIADRRRPELGPGGAGPVVDAEVPAPEGVGADEPDRAVGADGDVGAGAGKLGPGGAVPVVDEVARVDDPGVAAGSTAMRDCAAGDSAQVGAGPVVDAEALGATPRGVAPISQAAPLAPTAISVPPPGRRWKMRSTMPEPTAAGWARGTGP